MRELPQRNDSSNFRKSLVRLLSVVILFIAVLTVQTAIAADRHDLQADRGHCAICHAGQSTALPAQSAIPVAAPSLVVWFRDSAQQQLSGEPYARFQSSRAPPSWS